jgi:hypothetical protein
VEPGHDPGWIPERTFDAAISRVLNFVTRLGFNGGIIENVTLLG